MTRLTICARTKYFFLTAIFLCLFAVSGAVRAATVDECEKSQKIVVLNYHKIANQFHSLAIRPAAFEEQMKYLVDNGYKSIRAEDLYQALLGKKKLPERAVMITFDDGYRDNYTNAYPILKRYGLTGTIFVVTKFLDEEIYDYLTWPLVQEMVESGVIDIGSHTVSHSPMTEISDDKLRYELTESKRVIEEKLHRKADFVAYPTGTFNLHIANIVKECGYKAAFTIKYGNVDEMTNLYAIERLPIFQTPDTFGDFVNRLEYVPMFAEFGWVKN